MRSLAMYWVCFLLLLVPGACQTSSGEKSVAPAKTQVPDPTMTLGLGTPEAFTVPVGQIILFSFDHHSSVGNEGDHSISDVSVVSFVEKLIKYEDPESVAAGESGGDGALGTFVFRAEKPGTTQLTVQTLFRGEVTTSATYTITVEQR